MQTIAHEWRTARKQHTCQLCWRTIEPGERYLHQRNVDYGDIWTWRNCAHCDTLMAIIAQIGYDHDYGITADDIGEWEPETIAHLRLKVYWQHSWRKPDGTLRPVPSESHAA